MSASRNNKNLRLAGLSLSFLALLLLSFSNSKKKESKSKGIAVVELFTSQGCSSCPAADRNLSQILASDKGNVFGLSFHVSYWNKLGWKDPYSSEKFTERQRDYASSFQNSSIYTPQMVVNGTTEFVGSNRSESQKAITEALSQAPEHHIHLEANLISDKINLDFTVNGEADEYIINIALVERNISTNIPRGENRNKILRHDNVVRSFTSKPMTQEGKSVIFIPDRFVVANGSVIAYVQNKNSLKITGATALDLAKL